MNHRKIYAATLFSICLTYPAFAAQDEYLTAQQLQDIVRGDNFWCYNYTDSCAWIEDININENRLTQWLIEYNSDNKIMIKYVPTRLNNHLMCDVKTTVSDGFSVFYYLDKTHRWQAVEKIETIYKYSDQYINKTLDDYNKFTSCYAYIDRGFTITGHQQLEQVIFFGGENGKRATSSDMVSIIPKLQMHGVKLTPKS